MANFNFSQHITRILTPDRSLTEMKEKQGKESQRIKEREKPFPVLVLHLSTQLQHCDEFTPYTAHIDPVLHQSVPDFLAYLQQSIHLKSPAEASISLLQDPDYDLKHLLSITPGDVLLLKEERGMQVPPEITQLGKQTFTAPTTDLKSQTPQNQTDEDTPIKKEI